MNKQDFTYTSNRRSRRDITGVDGAVANVKLFPEGVRLTVVQQDGHHAHVDLDLDGLERLLQKLDYMADVLDGTEDPPEPVNVEERRASYGS